jgi:hypothetical protein
MWQVDLIKIGNFFEKETERHFYSVELPLRKLKLLRRFLLHQMSKNAFVSQGKGDECC